MLVPRIVGEYQENISSSIVHYILVAGSYNSEMVGGGKTVSLNSPLPPPFTSGSHFVFSGFSSLWLVPFYCKILYNVTKVFLVRSHFPPLWKSFFPPSFSLPINSLCILPCSLPHVLRATKCWCDSSMCEAEACQRQQQQSLLIVAWQPPWSVELSCHNRRAGKWYLTIVIINKSSPPKRKDHSRKNSQFTLLPPWSTHNTLQLFDYYLEKFYSWR